MEKEKLTHASFGQIQFNTTSGNGTSFYGSELTQGHYVSLEIHHSEIHRDLSMDRYYNRGEILRLRMSSGQFAELITSMNRGSGVPCTIERVSGKKIEELPVQESRKEFIHRKFNERMKNFASNLKEKQNKAKELIAKKTLSKEDTILLKNYIDWLTQEISSNIPFFAECFQETMDAVVFEAKLEVENAIQHKINTLGLNALKDQTLLE